MLPLYWRTEITVQTYQLDFYGVVNNAVYLNYLETARLDLMRQLNIDFFKMVADGVVPVVARAVIDYKAPIRGGEVVVVRGTVATLGGSSMDLQYSLESKFSGHEMAQAETRLVFVNERGRPTRIPDSFRAAIEGGLPAAPQ